MSSYRKTSRSARLLIPLLFACAPIFGIDGELPPAAGHDVDFEKEIRPLLDDMLDFEKTMAARSNIDHGQFKQNGTYQLLRAGLVDRWEVLNELGTYPHMLTPLDVTAS